MSEKETTKPIIRTYKYCLVPMCSSTTIKCPEKIFFRIPHKPEVRREWCRIMKRTTISNKTHKHVCEDHFNVEKDMDNYMRHKLMGGIIRLREGAVPTKFECQKDLILPKGRVAKKRAEKERQNSQKKGRKKALEYSLDENPSTSYAEEKFIDTDRDESAGKDPLATDNTENKIAKLIMAAANCLKSNKAVQVQLKKSVAHKQTETEKDFFTEGLNGLNIKEEINTLIHRTTSNEETAEKRSNLATDEETENLHNRDEISVKLEPEEQMIFNEYSKNGDVKSKLLTSNNDEELDETDHFFISVSKTLKKLPWSEQAELRMQIAELVAKAEMKYLKNNNENCDPLSTT